MILIFYHQDIQQKKGKKAESVRTGQSVSWSIDKSPQPPSQFTVLLYL